MSGSSVVLREFGKAMARPQLAAPATVHHKWGECPEPVVGGLRQGWRWGSQAFLLPGFQKSPCATVVKSLPLALSA